MRHPSVFPLGSVSTPGVVNFAHVAMHWAIVAYWALRPLQLVSISRQYVGQSRITTGGASIGGLPEAPPHAAKITAPVAIENLRRQTRAGNTVLWLSSNEQTTIGASDGRLRSTCAALQLRKYDGLCPASVR